MLSAFFIINAGNLSAQGDDSQRGTDEYLIVDEIVIEGNRRTKPKTILREMDIAPGDTLLLKHLPKIIERNENQIYNTELFNEVVIQPDSTEVRKPLTRLVVKVEERWYTFIWPTFELADRNVNVWAEQHNYDFSRVKYGFNFYQYNVRGRNETFELYFRWGFNRKLIFNYRFPFIDKSKVIGLNLKAVFIADRELPYRLIDNKEVFYRHTSFANRRTEFAVELTRRKKIRFTHFGRLSYFGNSVVDTLQSLNPDYFEFGEKKQRFFFVQYQLEDDQRDIKRYPLKGTYFRLRLEKQGLGIFNDVNSWAAEANYSIYKPLILNWFAGFNIRARASTPGELPYYNTFKIGFLENFVRGYERNVILAQHYVTAKHFFKFRLFQKVFKNNWIKIDQFHTIPLQVFLKFHHEGGYTSAQQFNEQNPLHNKWIYGYGIGLDIFTMYDALITMDYSFNIEGEHGFFLHFNLTWDFRK